MAYTNYKVIKAPLDVIGAQIAVELLDGWQPFGPPALVYPQDKEIYQALVKGTPDVGLTIEEYQVARASLDAIQGVVEEAIADDWQPFGGPVYLYPQEKEVYQALIKGTVI